MKDLETTDEQMFSMRYKTFIPMMIGIILVTNTATLLINNVDSNTTDINYNYDRVNRKGDAMYNEMKAYVDKRFYELKIEELERENHELTGR